MIVTFYSYKGGVGRSMAMANVALWFRLQGLKVVAVDWDLEAPGLETFFIADKDEREATKRKLGLIDLIATYRDLFPGFERPASRAPGDDSATPAPAGAIDEDFLHLLDKALPPIRHMLVPIRTTAAEPDLPGGLWLLTAGSRGGDRFDAYAETVQRFDWDQLYARFEGETYFEWMRRQFLESDFADIVLIDSRTGVAEMSGVCTRQLADVVVMLSAPNEQNLDGVARMARSFTRPELRAARGDQAIELVMVPARLHEAEGKPNDVFMGRFHERLDQYLPAAFGRANTSFDRLRIPYISAYAFEERLAVGDPEGVIALQQAYVGLAAHLALLAKPRSAVRRQCAAEMKARFGLPTVAVAVLDRALWDAADTFCQRLEAQGMETLRAPPDEPDAVLDSLGTGLAAHAVVFAGTAPDQQPRARALWRRARERGVCMVFAGVPQGGAVPWRGVSFIDPQDGFEELTALLRQPCRARPVPMLAPPKPPTFVPRDVLFRNLKSLVLAEDGGPRRTPIALVGAGGNGKTTLVKALCDDDDVVDRFDGGILWLGLGAGADVREALIRQVQAFGEPIDARLDVDEAQRRLSVLLETRRCLIVADDASESAQLERIPRGGPGCLLLIVSRSNEVASAAAAHLVEVGGLAPAEARRLLALPGEVDAAVDERALEELVASLGGSPLALKLAGESLIRRVQGGASGAAAMLDLQKELRRSGLAAIDNGTASHWNDSILATLQLATERLTPSDRACLAALADLPAGRATQLSEVCKVTGLSPDAALGLAMRMTIVGLARVDTAVATIEIHPVAHAYFKTLQQREQVATQTRTALATPTDFSVYVSYVRQDTGSYATRVHWRMAAALGYGAVFLDTLSLQPGDDWSVTVERAIDSASVVLVLIGPAWVELVQRKDRAIHEIEEALKLGKRVIPVLVGNAEMPSRESLPASLRDLAARNALVLGDASFEADMDSLLDAVLAARPDMRAMGAPSPRPAAARSAASDGPATSRPRRMFAIGAALLVTVVAGTGGLVAVRRSIAPAKPAGQAEFETAENYVFGRGVAPDAAAAVGWYQKSAVQGYASAQNALGRIYESGQGVSRDLSTAHYWYEKAAAQGHPDAKAALQRLDAYGSASDTPAAAQAASR